MNLIIDTDNKQQQHYMKSFAIVDNQSFEDESTAVVQKSEEDSHKRKFKQTSS